MCDSPYNVRAGIASDTLSVLQIAQAAQNKLTESGSKQLLAGYTPENVNARIARRELYILETERRILGSAFVERVTSKRFPHVLSWQVAPDDSLIWFLYGLVIDPAMQGQGLGRILLDGICSQNILASPAVLTLDCWAGNLKLRKFYHEAGFQLHGTFPEEDYQIAVFTKPIPKTQEAH